MPSPPFPSRLHRDTTLDSIHTTQTETLLSRVLCPTKVRWTGGKDRQTSGSSVRRRFWRAGGRGVELLTWLQTGLYLSPSLFTIYSSCLWLKLDTPMDLVSPVSLHFSRAWEGGVVSSHLEWARTRINVEKINKHGHHQELALSIKRKKGRKSSHQLKNYYFCLKKTNKQRRHITWEERNALFLLSKILHFIPLCEHFSNGFLPSTRASQPLGSWTAESGGPQPILTGGRNEGGFPSPGSSTGSLLPGLTSHVWQRSNVSNINFRFPSFGNNSSPGWNRSRHIRDVTK